MSGRPEEMNGLASLNEFKLRKCHDAVTVQTRLETEVVMHIVFFRESAGLADVIRILHQQTDSQQARDPDQACSTGTLPTNMSSRHM
ncbi:hypothetical protein SAMN05192563_1004309 [Paraburkholderia aspalathi]|uniref:Uncharacterized protein n=1 Tax=Paraburkholderia aspalathi TaxID=1324617 RepID=A0A1I7BA01_9BURK|nr:hypothetical protein SAMN05192563_1004309 [Paraburkholderia aspalathi]